MSSTATTDRPEMTTSSDTPDRNALECAACNGSNFARLFEKSGRQFWKCRTCGMQRQFPLPTLDELKDYYESSYREGLYQQFADAREMKRLTAAARWRAVRRYASSGTWLDVGCADGVFLAELAKHQVDATGIDLSEVAVTKAKDRGLSAHCQTIAEHQPAKPYDVISAFDVLEHVLDPRSFLSDIRRLLKPGGTLVLSTPNLLSISRLVMGRRWYFYIPEEHLFYFAPRSLKLLLANTGFELVARKSVGKPLTFDYSLTQFEQYNPLIYRMLKAGGALLPRPLREISVPLHIGEMLAVAKRRS